jgi:transcription elongation factor Elf1
MAENLSYDIYVLGLKDPSAQGRRLFATTIEDLTGRSYRDFDDHFPTSVLPIFQSLDTERARRIVDTLSDAGIIIEVRPVDAPPSDEVFEADAHTRTCPACDKLQPAAAEECKNCGIVFAKYERELLLKMQMEHSLEQAMIKAAQVREEWVHRAKKYLETHKLAEDATQDFSTILMQDEVPFLLLNSDEGPILLTSRRILAKVDGKFQSIPFEMIHEVEYGGSRLSASRKSKKRLQLNFHSPFAVDGDEVIKNVAWHLDKDSSFSKEVVFEWGYARNFLCGSCGERDLQYRTDDKKVNARCMHCATDHEIDLAEGAAIPQIAE